MPRRHMLLQYRLVHRAHERLFADVADDREVFVFLFECAVAALRPLILPLVRPVSVHVSLVASCHPTYSAALLTAFLCFNLIFFMFLCF